jgi:hypothetical protein
MWKWREAHAHIGLSSEIRPALNIFFFFGYKGDALPILPQKEESLACWQSQGCSPVLDSNRVVPEHAVGWSLPAPLLVGLTILLQGRQKKAEHFLPSGPLLVSRNTPFYLPQMLVALQQKCLSVIGWSQQGGGRNKCMLFSHNGWCYHQPASRLSKDSIRCFTALLSSSPTCSIHLEAACAMQNINFPEIKKFKAHSTMQIKSYLSTMRWHGQSY